VPSTYNCITENELIDAGVSIVIYANHLLRSAYPAMQAVAESILCHGRSLEADDQCLPIDQILSLIPAPDPGS
jgi:phosphoenolpyruvate phosphomutase